MKLSETCKLYCDGEVGPMTKLNEEKERSPCLGQGEGTAISMWHVQRRLILDVLLIGWGAGTWLGVNGLYVQLPLLVARLPEGWALPASMALAVQLGNTGLLAYALLRRLFPRVSEAPYIYALLVVGALALTLNSFLYTYTAVVGSTERSVAFLILTFFAALVGCTSSVLFYPYMRHFRDVYLTTYLFGEGLSGFMPSILALIQGVGGQAQCVPSDDDGTLVAEYPPALFDTNVFLLVLGALGVVSLVCFSLLDRSTAFEEERVSSLAVEKRDEVEEERAPKEGQRWRWAAAMALMTLLSAFGNGVMPSVQSYSCMPYGPRAYHLAVSLSAAATPSACLVGVLAPPLSGRVLAGVLTLSLAPFCYMLSTALLSPYPPLLLSSAGEPLIIIVWVWITFAVAYGRMWVYVYARRGGARGMQACGALGQVGSAVGSLALFGLVNYTGLFVQADVCANTD